MIQELFAQAGVASTTELQSTAYIRIRLFVIIVEVEEGCREGSDTAGTAIIPVNYAAGSYGTTTIGAATAAISCIRRTNSIVAGYGTHSVEGDATNES